MPVTNIGLPVSLNSRLFEALAPRFAAHIADWVSRQQASGPDAHCALPYLERLDPRETAEDTFRFVMGFFRPGLSPTPVSEVSGLLGGLSLAVAEIAGAPIVLDDQEVSRLSGLLGTKLIELFAEATGLILVRQKGANGLTYMLNPETTQREPVSTAKGWHRREQSSDSSPRAERMLRALRDMRDFRERRQLRQACY